MSDNTLSRRKFLRASGLSGTALLLGFYFPAGARDPKIIKADDAEIANIELKAWILINPAGKVTLVSHRAEMGQGVYQSIAQIIAEELEVDLDEVDIIFARGNNKKYGSQITGGSSTIRGSYQNLLKCECFCTRNADSCSGCKMVGSAYGLLCQIRTCVSQTIGQKISLR